MAEDLRGESRDSERSRPDPPATAAHNSSPHRTGSFPVIRKHQQLPLVIALATVPALFACERKAEDSRVDTTPPATIPSATENVRVSDVDLGNGIDANKNIAGNEDDEFKPA